MIKFDVTEDTYFKRNSFSYTLSILVGMDSVRYMVTDATGAILAVKEYDFSENISSDSDFHKELEALFSKNHQLKSNYGKVKICFTHHKAALIPERLYDEKRNRTYLEHLTDIEKEYDVLSNEVSDLAVKTVFPFKKSLESIYKKYFPEAGVYHISTALIGGFFKQLNAREENQVFVHFQKERLHIAFFKEKELVFYNTFSIKAASDLAYYLLLVFQQHGLSQETVPVTISGKIMGNSEFHRIIKRYAAKVSFMAAPAFVQTGPRLSLHPTYMFFDLWALQRCD